MTTKKFYGPWIYWNGGKCPVPPDTLVEAKLRSGVFEQAQRAKYYDWRHTGGDSDIVSYRTITEQPDLEAAEKLLLNYGYTIIPPVKPLTFEDVVPMTEAPQRGTRCWAIDSIDEEGAYEFAWFGSETDQILVKRRLVYLEKEHALIAARHIFGLKGGEL